MKPAAKISSTTAAAAVGAVGVTAIGGGGVAYAVANNIISKDEHSSQLVNSEMTTSRYWSPNVNEEGKVEESEIAENEKKKEEEGEEKKGLGMAAKAGIGAAALGAGGAALFAAYKLKKVLDQTDDDDDLGAANMDGGNFDPLGQFDGGSATNAAGGGGGPAPVPTGADAAAANQSAAAQAHAQA